ncbi:MAG: 2-phospho-L-lactate guanylyltransferase [Candidatus Binatia bacterium]
MRFAVLPMKPLALAKSRLATSLSDAERQAVSFAMFHDVLEALLRARRVDAVAVVTADRRLLDLAARMRVVTIDEGAPRGLNAAAAIGTERCLVEGASSVVVMLADLPFVTSDEIDTLLDRVPNDPHVRLVRSHEGLGTNAILRSPPAVISTRFGGRSFQDHVAAAADAEVSCSSLELPGVSFDVDTIEDLQELALVARPTRTFFEARKIGIVPARLP